REHEHECPEGAAETDPVVRIEPGGLGEAAVVERARAMPSERRQSHLAVAVGALRVLRHSGASMPRRATKRPTSRPTEVARNQNAPRTASGRVRRKRSDSPA